MAKKTGKITLQVEAIISPEGWAIPHELKYNDETFSIIDPVRSMKLFDGATRWRCSIDGRQVEIFNIDDSWWMEKQ